MKHLLTLLALGAGMHATPSQSPTTLFLSHTDSDLFSSVYRAHGLDDIPRQNILDPAHYLTLESPQGIGAAQRADALIREYLNKEGTLELFVKPDAPQQAMFPCAGGAALVTALVYAIIHRNPESKFLFVEKQPYYHGHPASVELFHSPRARFCGYTKADQIDRQPDEILVEFVTSLNNPDGSLRKPETDADIIIADLVLSAPVYGNHETDVLDYNLAWLRDARAQGKHVFSFDSASKHFGKNGWRFAYLWFDMADPFTQSLFPHFYTFISRVGGISSATGALFMDLITTLVNLPDNGRMIFQHVRASLIKRHQLLTAEFAARYPESIIKSVEGSPTFFAQLPPTLQTKAVHAIKQDCDVTAMCGSQCGADDSHIRINLLGDGNELAEFLNRLAGKKQYTQHDLIIFF